MSVIVKQEPAPIRLIEAPCSAGRDSTLQVNELTFVPKYEGYVRFAMHYGPGHTGVSFLTPDEAVQFGEAVARFGRQMGGS